MALRVHELVNWHSEFYIDSRVIADEVYNVLLSLPCVVIDHTGLSDEGFENLLMLLRSSHSSFPESRRVYVKATGFNRFNGGLKKL
jgi:predicted TIM-barrel fold metal-dependent hydrolase